MLARPVPPSVLFDLTGPAFLPAPDLTRWAKATFIVPGSPLQNEDHIHLQDAAIGFLWTTIAQSRQMNAVAGQAEIPRAQGNKWARGRHDQQLMEWFGEDLDFLITLDANYARQADDASFCALVEHELYHCGQERNVFGGPKFRQDGSPAFGIRGHDVEEFVGIVRRYGVGAAAGQTLALVEAAKQKPEIARARITAACGTCRALIV